MRFSNVIRSAPATSIIATIAALLVWPIVNALPYDHLDDQVNAAIDAGTFQNPSANIRPKMRYWLPDASVDVDKLAADVASIASIGVGAIELLNYFLYGGEGFKTQPEVPVDWDIYNFGTPAYNAVLLAALKACKHNGLLMDFSVGVQSGQGAPAEIPNPGLAWFLNASFTIIEPGQIFSGTIPGFGRGSLVSVVTAEIISQTTQNGYELYTVTESSLQEVTSNVTSDGTLNIKFPDNSAASVYLLYAAYAIQPLVRSGLPGPNPQNFIQNGSFAVDHFSSTGAKVTTDFLEQYVLINGAKELLKEVGNYIWEDSIEIQGPSTSIYWTPSFPSAFEAQHGYSILPFLPLLAQQDGSALTANPPFAFQTSSNGKGISYVDDFRTTLTSLYRDYVNHWTSWANSYLDLQSSAQIGYNLPVDVQSNIPFSNAPEGETWQFLSEVDAFRQFSGPANLAGKRIISVELGAEVYYAYSLPLPRLLFDAKRTIAGGVNAFVIHGSPYSYYYPNTTWPGYTAFDYQFSEQYQRHQPAWENGYKEAMYWLGRTSFVMQSGIPKKDLVLWVRETYPDESLPNLYEPTDLTDAGYMYEYLSPENFALPQAVVTNGILAENGPGYKALILRQSDTLTVDGVIKLAEFAKAGLPIVAAGGFPTYFSPQNATANELVNTTLASISTLPNVHIVSDVPVASVVRALGIVPRTQINSNGTWCTVWRTTNTTDFVFIFNNEKDSVGSIKFASTATPYFFDAWTGTQVAVLNYTIDTASATTEIAFSLKANQTVIVAFSNETISGVEVPAVHFISAPEGIVGFSYSNATGLIAKVSASVSQGQALTASNGQEISLKATSVPAAFELTNWNLTAEHWDPPSNLSDIDIIAVKYNTTHTNLAYPLLDWNSIPGLANTSGIGHYSSSLIWPPASINTNINVSSIGAILTFKSPVLHTLRVSINSIETPPVDPTNPTLDISPYLINGSNIIEAKVATIMYNGLVPVLEKLRTAGSSLGFPRNSYPAFREVGLVGSVEVVPYVKVEFTAGMKPGKTPDSVQASGVERPSIVSGMKDMINGIRARCMWLSHDM